MGKNMDKCPHQLPKISCTAIASLRTGESVVVGPCRPSQVSAQMSRLKPMSFVQQQVLVVEPRSATTQKMFCVTRVA